MAKRIIVHDPYRDRKTTLTEFAKAEGVKRAAVSHFYWWHKSLEGFRDRPAKGTGNGIKPHTYTHNGGYVTIQDAKKITGMNETTLMKYRERYGINDIDKIRHRYDAERQQRYHAKCYKTDDGRMMTINEYAKEVGATYNAVALWVSRKGSFKGYLDRGHSRINPIMYRHSGMGVAKTKKEWARYFKCSTERIKTWFYTHNRDMKGFETRTKRSKYLIVAYHGKKATLAEWARKLGVLYVRIYK